MKLLIQLSPAYNYFLSLSSRYSPKNPEHTQFRCSRKAKDHVSHPFNRTCEILNLCLWHFNRQINTSNFTIVVLTWCCYVDYIKNYGVRNICIMNRKCVTAYMRKERGEKNSWWGVNFGVKLRNLPFMGFNGEILTWIVGFSFKQGISWGAG